MNTYRLLFLTGLFISQLTLFCMDKQLIHQRKNSIKVAKTIQELKADTCSFCREPLSAQKGALLIPPCEHPYHSDCVNRLKGQSYTSCLICRDPLETFDEKDEDDVHCCMSCMHSFFEGVRKSSVDYENLITHIIFDLTSPHITWSEIFQKLSDASERCADEHAIN